MRKLKELSLGILAIITLSSCLSKSKKEPSFQYGWENRLMSALIDMDCSVDNMAIYSGFNAYRLSADEYEIISDKSDIGQSDFVFKINFLDTSIVSNFKDASISYCKNGEVYIGRGQPSIDSHLPPACHFYFSYDEKGYITRYNNGELTCFSTMFLTPDEYAEKVLGVKK